MTVDLFSKLIEIISGKERTVSFFEWTLINSISGKLSSDSKNLIERQLDLFNHINHSYDNRETLFYCRKRGKDAMSENYLFSNRNSEQFLLSKITVLSSSGQKLDAHVYTTFGQLFQIIYSCSPLE
jgi:hypothetical protein